MIKILIVILAVSLVGTLLALLIGLLFRIFSYFAEKPKANITRDIVERVPTKGDSDKGPKIKRWTPTPAIGKWMRTEGPQIIKQNWFKLAVIILWSITIFTFFQIHSDLDSLCTSTADLAGINSSISDINSSISQTNSDIEAIANQEGVVVPALLGTGQYAPSKPKGILDKIFYGLHK